jgi:hypothetical protein
MARVVVHGVVSRASSGTDRALYSRPRFAASTLWCIRTASRRSQRRGLIEDHDALRAIEYRLPRIFAMLGDPMVTFG